MMLEIFQFHFMQRAFAAGIAVAIIAPLIGMFLVVRRYSLMADTLAHVSFLGVAIGFLTNISPLLSAILLAMLSAVGMEKLRKNQKLSGDAVLAIFLFGGLAAAIVLLSIARGFNVNLFSFLFGSISTVSGSDLWFIISLCALVLLAIAGFYKELFLVSLDEELAQANGLKTDLYNLILVLLTAMSVALSIKIIGVLLIGALMVIPVMAATQFGKSFSKTICIAILFSLISVIVGLFLSYYIGLASGGTIVMISLIIFFASLFLRKTQA